MTEKAIIITACMFAVAIICFGAAIGAAWGNGNLTGKGLESMARQPEESGKLFTNMLVSAPSVTFTLGVPSSPLNSPFS